MTTDYSTVTEVTGEPISKEQLQRMCNRYYWAKNYIENKDILEVACGVGQGLSYLANFANKTTAGDICSNLVEKAKINSKGKAEIHCFDAENMPFEDQSFDTILIFEAIYYIKNPERFLQECKRLLKPNGQLLIVTTNKDLYDFNPSPYSQTYFGVAELNTLLKQFDFQSNFFVDSPIKKTGLKQKALRPLKKIAVSLNLIPKTMKGKVLLKRLIFGKQLPMPSAIDENSAPYIPPTKVACDQANKTHQVIFCAAQL